MKHARTVVPFSCQSLKAAGMKCLCLLWILLFFPLSCIVHKEAKHRMCGKTPHCPLSTRAPPTRHPHTAGAETPPHESLSPHLSSTMIWCSGVSATVSTYRILSSDRTPAPPFIQHPVNVEVYGFLFGNWGWGWLRYVNQTGKLYNLSGWICFCTLFCLFAVFTDFTLLVK